MRSAQCFWVPKPSSNGGPKPDTHSGSSAIRKANLRFEEKRRKWWARRSRRGRARARAPPSRGCEEREREGGGPDASASSAGLGEEEGEGGGPDPGAAPAPERAVAMPCTAAWEREEESKAAAWEREDRKYFTFAVGNERI